MRNRGNVIRRSWAIATIALMSSLLIGACSNDTGGGTPPSAPPPASEEGPKGSGQTGQAVAGSDFAKQVLADGKVSREELDQAYHRLGRCLVDGGGEGEFWALPDLGFTSPSLRVSTADDSVQQLLDRCHEEFDAIEFRYAAEHPQTEAQKSQALNMAKSCIQSKFPDLASEIPAESTIDSLLKQFGDQLNNDQRAMPVVDGCLQKLGVPLRPLSEL